ncbi:heme exporter protein CcmD [Bosea sp. (in: a-proteobacteria)]|jgi:heme exporter protein CcmD|uniref:heme exporter protein CcmD n=1 Tax=Bosea sp. (in: a-proteobacteria) TaxID=1871050 RepID=UPI00086D5B16|nr:heme exporter protein CcmD [Bosea sp. (in: a-proteobacteria)]ODT44680.1 MAG: heme exporter protein CcmD [Methylobacterium sp. SCN 67-24]
MMLELGPHGGFILAAYLASGLILCGLAALILLDRRAQRRALALLEQQGIGRRSERKTS